MITNERIADYIYSLEKDKPNYLNDIEKQALSEHIPIIKKPTQAMLRFLLRLHRPKRILEVGTAVGFSALLMAEYMPKDCILTTIEKMPARIEKAAINIQLSEKKECIQLLEGDASIILANLVSNANSFDFIFMDAAKGQYINFLSDIMNLLTPCGLLVSDNVLQDGDVVESRYGITRRNRTIHMRMREYLYTLTHMQELETVILPIGDGITLSTKMDE